MKGRKLKGMTIAENIIAMTIILLAVAIAGTGFSMAGNLLMKGMDYEKAADTAQEVLVQVQDKIYSAHALTARGTDANGTKPTFKLDNAAIKTAMTELGYTYDSKNKHYLNSETGIIIKPYSVADGSSSYKIEIKNIPVDNEHIKTVDMTGNNGISNVYGIYIRVCVPVNRGNSDKYVEIDKCIQVWNY